MSIKKVENRNFVVEVSEDNWCESPREWGTIGKIIYSCREYILGDEDVPDLRKALEELAEPIIDRCEYDQIAQLVNRVQYIDEMSLDDLIMAIELENIILPVYAYIHSGVTISTSEFHDPWDSGLAGFIYVPYDNIKKEYGDLSKKSLKLAKEALLNEIDIYLINIFVVKLTTYL
jgi:hypothetical protein